MQDTPKSFLKDRQNSIDDVPRLVHSEELCAEYLIPE